MVGHRLCRRFCSAFTEATGHDIRMFTYNDALRYQSELKAACKDAVAITHSAGNVLIELFACEPKSIRMFSPPSKVSALQLFVRLVRREVTRFGRHDSIMWGWYRFTFKQARTLGPVLGYSLEAQTKRIADWQVIVPVDDPLFPPKSYPKHLRHSERFITMQGHHEALYFDYEAAIETLKF